MAETKVKPIAAPGPKAPAKPKPAPKAAKAPEPVSLQHTQRRSEAEEKAARKKDNPVSDSWLEIKGTKIIRVDKTKLATYRRLVGDTVKTPHALKQFERDEGLKVKQ